MMQLERRDLRVLIAAEADSIAALAASTTTLMANLPDMKKAVAKLTLLLEALEAVGAKR